MALRRPFWALIGIVVTLALVLVAACRNNGEPDVIVETATPTATATAPVNRTPNTTPTPFPTEDPGAGTISALRNFIDDYGFPGDANFAQLRIPSLNVSANVGSRFVGRDGYMAAPSGPADVIWYDLSPWPGMGGTPGSGNAIFSGHLNYAAYVPYADVNYRGLGVFAQIGQLSDGDIIEVDYGGETQRYAVVSVQDLHATQADWGSVWQVGSVDSITLYTCGGDFDPNSREYSHRIVVRANRI